MMAALEPSLVPATSDAGDATGVPPVAPVPAITRPRRRRGCLLALVAFLVAYVGWEAVNWPDVRWYADHDPKSSAFIERYRRRAERAGLPPPRHRWSSYRRISRSLKQAVIAAEDMEFFDHDGFSRHELEASLRDAWEEKELPRGASTITQQTAKNLWL
ncbi:MAG TPA: transglycosylase domain-containing protein, partial [Thermoanaerobaculia bacterium]|nr:transglycosylase domain-containing protein [Thermoanaerobaculia bacterium]